MKTIVSNKKLRKDKRAVLRTGEIRGYKSNANRKRAISLLHKHGYNYFVCFRDTQSEFALQYGRAAWVADGQKYVCG